MVAAKFAPGMVNEISFGGPWGSSSCMVTFYGDISHASAQWSMDAATANHPDEASLADHQKFAVNFRFSAPRPYGMVCELFDKSFRYFEWAGWALAPAIEGIHDSGSSIDDLISNPEWPEIEGLEEMTGANGFTLIIEKVGTKPMFSDDERVAIPHLARKAMVEVFGTELPLWQVPHFSDSVVSFKRR